MPQLTLLFGRDRLFRVEIESENTKQIVGAHRFIDDFTQYHQDPIKLGSSDSVLYPEELAVALSDDNEFSQLRRAILAAKR